MKVYAVKNPYWLADTFIFACDDHGRYSFVKINHANKIEEIGIDIVKRMHYPSFQELIASKDAVPATRLQASIYRRIGNEYFAGLYNRQKYKEEHEQQ